MSDTRNGISARDSHIWSLRIGLVLSTVISLTLVGFIAFIQNTNIRVQLPPDLSRGATVRPGDYFRPTTYLFAIHTWREINEWRTNGRHDYEAKLKVYECYLTPSFYKWLDKQRETKARAGELDRTRRTVPISPYRNESVVDLGANTFSVTLKLNLIEEIKKSVVKDVNISYPLRVVPDFRSCNRTGLALDGFFGEPHRIDNGDQ